MHSRSAESFADLPKYKWDICTAFSKPTNLLTTHGEQHYKLLPTMQLLMQLQFSDMISLISVLGESNQAGGRESRMFLTADG